MPPIRTGTIAPPTIAVLKIPENEPWCSATELSAREMTMGHITEVNSPIQGKAISETFAGPKRAAQRQHRAPAQAPTNTLRLSKIFKSNIPTAHPPVNRPQNHDTAVAPVVCGSKPWYWYRNFE